MHPPFILVNVEVKGGRELLDMSVGINMRGEVWRAVVNFLGNARVTPELYMFLIQYMAGRPTPPWSYLDRLPGLLVRERDRSDLVRDVRMATIAFWLWETQSDAIYQWANRSRHGPFDLSEVDNWWFSSRSSHVLNRDERERWDEFLAAVNLSSDDLEFLQWVVGNSKLQDMLVTYLRMDLPWITDLEILRDLARKTWPADLRAREMWQDYEFSLIREHYADQQLELEEIEPGDGGVNPFSLRPIPYEGGLGVGLWGLGFPMTILIRSATIDFMEEILDHSRFPGIRGSLRCEECGLYAARRNVGYGQLYCSETCKKRAAKRRYRARISER